MKSMTLSSEQKNTYTAISNLFLDNYMKDANGEFVKVYLYILRGLSNGATGITPSDIADSLNLTENDVIRALRYWNSVNVLSVSFDESGRVPEAVCVNALDGTSESAVSIVEETAPAPAHKDTSDDADSYIPVKTPFSAEELSKFKSQDSISQLFYIIEKYIGKPLSPTDFNTVLYIKDTLGFSSELIEYLVEYCVSNRHTSLRYMEKVAIAWFEEGIRTVDDAMEASTMYSSRVIPVIKAFGITGRTLTSAETDFINRWYDEYGFDKEIITEACKRTILSLAKPSFSYTDGTLKKWHTAGVHTMEDIKKQDSGFKARISVPVTHTQPARSNNSFNNFTQRTYNFEELEKQLLGNNK